MQDSTKVCITLIVLLMGVIVFGGYYGSNYMYDTGYSSGFSDGRQEGYSDGYDQGMEDGKIYAEATQPTQPAVTRESLSTDNAPEGTVWTTPSGEKYHEGWCRYISGRHDLTYFYSAEDAVNAGFSPCSVCH